MRADVCYASQEVADIYSSMWDAVKEMPGAQQEYGSKAGARRPYNSKIKKILSREFALLAEDKGNEVEKEVQLLKLIALIVTLLICNLARSWACRA